MKNPKIIITDEKEVYCDGDDIATGHPKVYFTFEGEREIICPYCSKKFIQK